jgi:uncharacterized protein
VRTQEAQDMSNIRNPYAPNQHSLENTAAVQRAFLTKVYGWMALALALTGVVAIATASNIEPFLPLLQGRGLIVVLLAQLGIVLAMSFLLNRISATVATALFLIYAIVTGFTLSTLFFVYTAGSIASVFFITAGTFAAVSAFGYLTKRNLSGWGNFLFIALIGLLLASLVNLFLNSETLMWVTTYAGVLIFAGLVAYRTQMLKNMAVGVSDGGDGERKAAVVGAFGLYLDFINLFLRLLRILGRRR